MILLDTNVISEPLRHTPEPFNVYPRIGIGHMHPSRSDTLPTPDASHVQYAVDRLVEAFHPVEIVVFGSYAMLSNSSRFRIDMQFS